MTSAASSAPSRAPGAGPAVALAGVTIRYAGTRGGALTAVADAAAEVADGEFVSIIGPSGCGKTSLLRAVGGLVEPAQGALHVLAGTPREAQIAKRLGFVFQDPALLPWRSVEANVRLPLEVNRGRGGAARSIEALLELVGLTRFRHYRPHELSGGMQQRVALARALVFSPHLLLMDEPFGALDEITREQMRYELLRIWAGAAEAGRRTTVLFVTHSVAEAVALSDRVLVMSSQPGRIIADVPVALPRPRTPEDERTPAFLDLLDTLRGLLREGAAA